MRQTALWNVLCLVIAVGALAAGAWTLATGQLVEQGIDGLFVLVVCVLTAVIFAVLPLQAIRRGELSGLLKRRPPKPAPPAAAGAPAEPREKTNVAS